MDKQEKEIVKRNEAWIKEEFQAIVKLENKIENHFKNIRELREQNRELKGR